MGLSVELMDFNGTILSRVDDPRNFLHRALPPMSEESQSVLAKIDWYGDTYFNYLQMKQFLQEWSGQITSVVSTEDEELLENIKNMALICQRDCGLLRFVGD